MSGPQSSSVQRLYTACKPNLNHNWNCNQNHSYLYIWSIIISGHHQCSLTTVRTRHKLFIHSHPMRWVVFGLSASSFGYQCAVLCDIESTIIAPLLHLAFNFIAKIKRVSESKQLRWFTSQHLVAEILSPTTCFNQHFNSLFFICLDILSMIGRANKQIMSHSVSRISSALSSLTSPFLFFSSSSLSYTRSL